LREILGKNEFFDAYSRIRSQVLKFYEKFVEDISDFECKKGCSDCCKRFTLLPVEFYFIKNNLKNRELSIEPHSAQDEACPFLKNKICQIYDIRPLMCITQGLPLLILNLKDDKMDVLICEKNSRIYPHNGGTNIKIFDYQSLISSMYSLNNLFCNKYKLSEERIDIAKLL
jgi:hypothetical protein